MASPSSIALRSVPLSTLLSKLVNGLPVAAAARSVPVVASRSFNTNTNDEDRSVDVERRPGRSVSRRPDYYSTPAGSFSDVFDPFSPTRSLSQVLNLMDQFMDYYYPLSSSSSSSSSRRGRGRGWDVREEDNALHLRIEMPGLSKEDVNISVDHNTLIIKGEARKESDSEMGGRRYSSRLDLPPTTYKVDEIKADIKNGVLKVVVPKVKQEERKDVYHVTVD